MFVGKIDRENPLNASAKKREMSRLGAQDFRGMLNAAVSKQGAGDANAATDAGALADAIPAANADSASFQNRPSSEPALANVSSTLPEVQMSATSGVQVSGGLSNDNLLKERALRPLSNWDMIRGIKAPPQPLKPLTSERHPSQSLSPMGPLDSVPGVRHSGHAQEDEVTKTARKWVAQTFYGTLFKQMRNSPFKSHLFDGGRGGQAFAPMLDQHLVDRMAKGSDKKLTAAIARRLTGKHGGSPAGMPGRRAGGPGSVVQKSVAAVVEPKQPSAMIGGPTTATGRAASTGASTSENPFEKVHIHVAPGI